MLQSMYSSVSGLVSQQARIDVIGDNIANANTIGFKVNTTLQQTVFDQMTRSAIDPAPVDLSVGLGTVITGTARKFTQGAFQRTDVPSDLGLQGPGWFQVSSGSGSSDTNVNYLTRAGNFVKDADGYLRTPGGMYLLGWQGTSAFSATGNTLSTGMSPTTRMANAEWTTLTSTGGTGFDSGRIRIPEYIGAGALGTNNPASAEPVASYSVGKDGVVTVVGSNGTVAEVGALTINRFINENGLRDEGSNLFSYNEAAGTQTRWAGGYNGTASVQAGVVEISNIDLAREFSNMILYQRGFDVNAKAITTSDEMLQMGINLKR